MTAPPTPVAAAPMATPVPAAPSCGAPDTRPVAMPGPKMPSASSASEASITTRAWSMDGSSGTVWNSANSPEPMPTMTASTSTLTPDDTTLPSTFSARKLVLFQSANGTSTKPASVVSLNSINVMKSCTASTKKQRITTNRPEQHHDGVEVHEHFGKTRKVADLLKNRRPSVDARLRQPAGLQEVLHRDGRAGGRQGRRTTGTRCRPAS